MGGRRGVDVGEGEGRPGECRLGSACLAGDQAGGEEVVVFGCGRRLGQAAADTTHAPPCGPLITASHRAQPHLWLSSELTLRAVYPPTLPYSCGPRRNSGPTQTSSPHLPLHDPLLYLSTPSLSGAPPLPAPSIRPVRVIVG